MATQTSADVTTVSPAATHVAPADVRSDDPQPIMWGHPRAFWTLAFVEMWERFGFYLMVSQLVLFLNERWLLTGPEAITWFGYYITAVYFSPLLGGFVAERAWNRAVWVTMGAGFLAVGYFGFALAKRETMALWFGLLIVGNGLFKANIAALLGSLYTLGDPRRDAAFSYFYLAVNIGGALSPIVGGLLRVRYGWSVAFSTAGVGLVIATAVLLYFTLHHDGIDRAKQSAAAANHDGSSASLRIAALLLLSVAVLPFWTAMMQTGSSLALWARDNTHRTLSLFGFSAEFAPEQFSSLGSVYILFLTVPLTRVLARFRGGRGIHSATKIVLGLLVSGTAFVVISLVASQTGSGQAHMAWLAVYYLIFTVGELLLSPVGMSIVSRISPSRWVGVMIGVWFVSTASGNLFVGLLGRYWELWSHSRYFATLGAALLAAALLLASQIRWLKRVIPSQP